MFTNYFITAWRNLIRHKAVSIINICGLGVGVAAALVIFIVVNHELSYDRFQKNYHRIYHIVTENKYADGITYNSGIAIPALGALRMDMPEMTFTALMDDYGGRITIENTAHVSTDKKFIENTGIFFCEPQFFKVFDYKWLAGNASVLNEPDNVVLTKSMAKKYFGDWKYAIGKVIKMDNLVTLKVAGVLNDVPSNTDFPLRVLVSFSTLNNNPFIDNFYDYTPDEWGNLSSDFQVYMLMPPNVNPEYVKRQISVFNRQHWNHNNISKESIFLQPLSEQHFDNRFQPSFGNHITSRRTLWILSITGIFILLMACINFVNLSVAQAVSRSKEMGIRKVLGGNRFQLFRQILTETVVVVLPAIILATILARLGMPYMKHLVSMEQQQSLFRLSVFLFLVIILIVVTILSGLYPALIMSGFNPAGSLKNKANMAKTGSLSLRSFLVIIQFTISQALIVCTIVMVNQMEFIRHADMGFDTEAVLILNNSTDSSALAKQSAFRQTLLQIPGVKDVSFNSDAPSSDNSWSSNFAYNHMPDEPYHIYLKYADTGYFKTYGIRFLAGRPYKASDTINQVVINNTLMHQLGINDPRDIISRQIRIGGGLWHTVTGVVKDFHTSSLRRRIQPLLITTDKMFYSNTAVKLRSRNIPETQKRIQSVWKKFYPEYAYSASFMDQDIADFYNQDRQLSLLYKTFAALAVFISCLGLYGLASLMAEQRTKEIGIRKVLGASVKQIVYSFSKEFIVLVMIAFIIATPAAYYFMHQWLNNFAYHVSMHWWIFLLTVLLTGLIAAATVGIKAVRAAVANPVEALRAE